MARKKTSTDSASDEELELDDETEVEAANTADETDDDETSDEDEGTEETADESDESDDEDEAESDEDEEAEGFTKRLTQFKGDTPEDYAKSLEDGYLETSKEGVRLARELKELKAESDRIKQVIATNPELAEALKTADADLPPTPPVDPALAWAKAERDKVWQKDYNGFRDLHPEIETDPVLAEQLNTKLAVVKQVVEQTEGRLVGMGEGLTMAWKLLGKDDSEETIRMAAKDSAAKGKTATGSSHETTTKTKFSESQIKTMMQISNIDRAEALKQLSAFN